MTKKYTPGPWYLSDDIPPCIYAVTNNDGEADEPCIAAVDAGSPFSCLEDTTEAGANACLISCAPELLEALEELVDDDEFIYTFGEGAHIRFKSLINKAKGETPY